MAAWPLHPPVGSALQLSEGGQVESDTCRVLDVASRLASAVEGDQRELVEPAATEHAAPARGADPGREGLLRRLLWANVGWYREGREGLQEAADKQMRAQREEEKQRRRERDEAQRRAIATYLRTGLTLSGDARPAGEQGWHVTIEPARRQKQRRRPRLRSVRWEAIRAASARRRRIEDGAEEDDGGGWQAGCVLQVRRSKKQGRPYRVKVRWQGVNPITKKPWDDSWVREWKWLGPVMRAEARRMWTDNQKARATKGTKRKTEDEGKGRRCSPRLNPAEGEGGGAETRKDGRDTAGAARGMARKADRMTVEEARKRVKGSGGGKARVDGDEAEEERSGEERRRVVSRKRKSEGEPRRESGGRGNTPEWEARGEGSCAK